MSFDGDPTELEAITKRATRHPWTWLRAVIGRQISEVLELTPAQLCPTRQTRVYNLRGWCALGFKSIGAQIVYNDDYDLGLPLHRQRRTFKRMGMELSSSSLADLVKWVRRAARRLAQMGSTRWRGRSTAPCRRQTMEVRLRRSPATR